MVYVLARKKTEVASESEFMIALPQVWTEISWEQAHNMHNNISTNVGCPSMMTRRLLSSISPKFLYLTRQAREEIKM